LRKLNSDVHFFVDRRTVAGASWVWFQEVQRTVSLADGSGPGPMIRRRSELNRASAGSEGRSGRTPGKPPQSRVTVRYDPSGSQRPGWGAADSRSDVEFRVRNRQRVSGEDFPRRLNSAEERSRKSNGPVNRTEWARRSRPGVLTPPRRSSQDDRRCGRAKGRFERPVSAGNRERVRS